MSRVLLLLACAKILWAQPFFVNIMGDEDSDSDVLAIADQINANASAGRASGGGSGSGGGGKASGSTAAGLSARDRMEMPLDVAGRPQASS